MKPFYATYVTKTAAGTAASATEIRANTEYVAALKTKTAAWGVTNRKTTSASDDLWIAEQVTKGLTAQQNTDYASYTTKMAGD